MRNAAPPPLLRAIAFLLILGGCAPPLEGAPAEHLGQSALPIQPWPVLLPVIAIAVLTLGTNLLADGFSRTLIGIERRDDGSV